MQAVKVMETDASTMNESQMRQAVKSLTEEVKNMQFVLHENTQLRRELYSLKLKGEHSTFLLKENCELKETLKTRQDFSKKCKEGNKYILELEEQLEKISKERDFLRKQMKYKPECHLLRKENRDLEAALITQEKEQREKIHILELEVEQMQKKAGEFQEKCDRLLGEKTTFQEERQKLKKQMSQLQLKLDELQLENKSLGKKVIKTCNLEHSKKVNELYLKKKCCELEKQLESSIKELRIKYPEHYFEDCDGPPRHMTESTTINRKWKDKLNDKSKQLEKNELILKEKDQQIEELKQDMSRRGPPEMLEVIPKCKWVIREQGKKIKALTAQLKLYQSKYEECRSRNEKLDDNVADMKKLYLKEKTEHTELWAVLATKSGDIPLLHSSYGLEKQARGYQVATKRPTLTPTALPRIPNNYQPKLGVTLGHTGSSTLTHRVLLKTDEKSDTTVTRNIHDKSGGKSRIIVLPPISNNSSQVQSTQSRKNIFMTEQDQHFV